MIPPTIEALVPSLDALEWVLAGGAVAGGGWRFIARPIVHRVRSFRESWAVIAGAVETVPVLTKSIEAIEAELRPNGGSSLRDQTNRIEKRIVAVENNAIVMRAAQRAIACSPSNTAMMETTPLGECHWVNQNWLDLTRQEPEEAIGWGWLNAIHQEERESVREEWDSASGQKRAVVATFRVCRGLCGIPANCTPESRARNGCSSIRYVASPILGADDVLLGYVAVLTPL